MTIGLWSNHDELLRAEVNKRIPTEAVCNDIDGVIIHILLHVVDGFMDEVQFFREDPSEIIELPPLETLEIIKYYG